MSKEQFAALGLTVGEWVDPWGNPVQSNPQATGAVFKVTKAENGIIEMELVEYDG